MLSMLNHCELGMRDIRLSWLSCLHACHGHYVFIFCWLFDNSWLGFRPGIAIEPLEILRGVIGQLLLITNFEGWQDVAQVSRNPIPCHQDSLNPADLPHLECPILGWAPKTCQNVVLMWWTWHEKSCHYKILARLVLMAWVWNDKSCH